MKQANTEKIDKILSFADEINKLFPQQALERLESLFTHKEKGQSEP